MKPPREIHFRSEKGEIEAFVCQENLLEVTSKENVIDTVVTGDVINTNECVVMPEDDEETKALFDSHSNKQDSSKSPTTSSLDLNSDIFWTQNELHGKFSTWQLSFGRGQKKQISFVLARTGLCLPFEFLWHHSLEFLLG